MALTSLSDEIRDFGDTAAIFCLVDLVISVDSSPTHLAGALGRPAWVMLPFVACMCVSTVWGRYHYVADVIAGMITGTLGYVIGRWLAPTPRYTENRE